MRVIWVVSGILSTSSSPQGGIEEAGVSGIPGVSLFQFEFPRLLMWAAPILSVGSVLLLTGYYILYGLLQGKRESGPFQYIILGGVIFSIFAVVFVSGIAGARRAMPSIIILTSPVFAWLVYNITSDNPQIGRYLAVLLIISTVSVGILTPPVAKAELGDDDFHPYLSADQSAAVTFAERYSDQTISGGYAQRYEVYSQVVDGNPAVDPSLQGVLNKDDPNTIETHRQMSTNGTTALFFEYYESAYNISEPETNRVYSSGKASIFT
jgi:hypothetical protein